MTSGKNNSDISTCQCDTNPQDVGKRQEDEWKERRPGPTQCISTVADIDDEKCARNTPVIAISPSATVLRLNVQGKSVHTQAQEKLDMR